MSQQYVGEEGSIGRSPLHLEERVQGHQEQQWNQRREQEQQDKHDSHLRAFLIFLFVVLLVLVWWKENLTCIPWHIEGTEGFSPLNLEYKYFAVIFCYGFMFLLVQQVSMMDTSSVCSIRDSHTRGVVGPTCSASSFSSTTRLSCSDDSETAL